MKNEPKNIAEEIKNQTELVECHGGIIPPLDWLAMKFAEASEWAKEKIDDWIKKTL